MDTSSLADAEGCAAAAAGRCSSMNATKDPCDMTRGEDVFSGGSSSLSLVVALLLLLLLLLLSELGRFIILRGFTLTACALDRAMTLAPKDAGVSGTSRTGLGLVAGVVEAKGDEPLESKPLVPLPEFRP